MTQPTTVNFSTQEQILSPDFNRVGSLAGKAVMDALLALIGGVNVVDPVNSMVRRGLLATPGAGLTVSLSAGELMRLGAAASDQSALKLAVLAADAMNIDITATAFDPQMNITTGAGTNPPDPGSPRIYRISAVETQAAEDLQTRNVITLPSRVVVPTSVPKTSACGILFTITAGFPAANPTPPATPAGQVALWDVYVVAAAVAVNDSDLMDLRLPFEPNALAKAHYIENGFSIESLNSTHVRVSPGKAWVNGALCQLGAPLTLGITQFNFDGGGTIGTSQEYAVYLVARNSGDPVAKGVTQGFIVVAVPRPTASANVNGDGRPAAPLTYRPFWDTGRNNVLNTTSNALFLGAARTDDNGDFEQGSWGQPISADAQSWNGVVDPATGGVAGAQNGFLLRPQLAFVDVNTISITPGYLLIGGLPMQLFDRPSASFGLNLFPGDVRTTGFFYVYARRNVSMQFGAAYNKMAVRSTLILISAEAPILTNTVTYGSKPTPEAGFLSTDYAYIGSFFSTGTTILPFIKNGGFTQWYGNVFGSGPLALFTGAVPGGVTAVGALLPAGSLQAYVVARILASTGCTSLFLRLWDDVLYSAFTSKYSAELDVSAGIGGTLTTGGPLVVSVGGAQFQVQAAATGAVSSSLTVDQIGYFEA